MKKIIILCSFFFCGIIFSQTENEVGFKSGIELYNKGDYNEAINCGATFIRVGSSIFGNRD